MRILTILMLLLSAPAWAGDKVPVKITADNMQYSQKNDEVVFSGNVYVSRQDVELWSNTLTVVLDKTKDSKPAAQGALAEQQGSIKKIIARGNVRLKSIKDRSGSCGRAEYDAGPDVLTMFEDPILMEGQNKIQGEVIKMFLKENRSEVIGGKKRVEAVFTTSDSKPGMMQ